LLIVKKFAYGCLGLGALTFVCMALLQITTADNQSHAQSSSSIAGNALIQIASAQVDSIYREASTDVAPKFKSFAAISGAFVRSNAIIARLQFEGMTNGLPGLFAVNSWLPRGAPSWTKGGIEGAVQASRGQANSLSGKIPSVKAAKSNIERLANIHPSLSSAGLGF
jgi:hypothetical protein